MDVATQSAQVQTITVNFLPVYIAYALAWCFVLVRARHRIRCSRQLGALLFLALYVGVMLYFTFEPFIFILGRSHWNANLIPLIESWKMLTQGVLSIALYNLLGNVLLFVPFGALLPLAFADMYSLRRVGMAGALTSLSIETLQLFFAVRLFDVDDVILNTIGSVLGYLSLCFVQRKFFAMPRVKQIQGVHDIQESLSLTLTGIVTFAAYIGLVIGVVFVATLSHSL